MEAAVLVGQETQEFLAPQGTGSDDHFIAAAGEDFQSHALTVFVEQARYGVVGLVLDNRRRRIAVDGQGAEPFPVAHVAVRTMTPLSSFMASSRRSGWSRVT